MEFGIRVDVTFILNGKRYLFIKTEKTRSGFVFGQVHISKAGDEPLLGSAIMRMRCKPVAVLKPATGLVMLTRIEPTAKLAGVRLREASRWPLIRAVDCNMGAVSLSLPSRYFKVL